MEVAVEAPKAYRDYTGVATWQLSAIIQEFQGHMSVDVDSRDLRSLIDSRTTFNGLALADKILLSLGLNISAMSNAGLITIIPAPGVAAPKRMAEDEWLAVRDSNPIIDPTTEELRDRAYELAALRDYMLGFEG